MTEDEQTEAMADENLADFIDIRVSSNICKPSDYLKKSGLDIYPKSIEDGLYQLELKLCIHLQANSFQWVGCGDDVVFTTSLSCLEQVIAGCNIIIDEFDRCVLKTYEQYSCFLTPHFTQEQWCKQNTLSVTEQKINF